MKTTKAERDNLVIHVRSLGLESTEMRLREILDDLEQAVELLRRVEDYDPETGLEKVLKADISDFLYAATPSPGHTDHSPGTHVNPRSGTGSEEETASGCKDIGRSS